MVLGPGHENSNGKANLWTLRRRASPHRSAILCIWMCSCALRRASCHRSVAAPWSICGFRASSRFADQHCTCNRLSGGSFLLTMTFFGSVYVEFRRRFILSIGIASAPHMALPFKPAPPQSSRRWPVEIALRQGVVLSKQPRRYEIELTLHDYSDFPIES